MDKLDKYIAYFRNNFGIITRMGPAAQWSRLPLEMYKHKEILMGWPEDEVYWFHKYGESFGIAKSVD
jgi:agmatine/peptidylarginine deiminase